MTISPSQTPTAAARNPLLIRTSTTVLKPEEAGQTVPDFLSHLQSTSQLKMLDTATQLATMICSPGVQKQKTSRSGRQAPEKAFRFPITEIADEEDKDETPRISNLSSPLIEEVGVIGLKPAEVRDLIHESNTVGEKLRINPQLLFFWKYQKKTSVKSEDRFSDTNIADQLKNFVFPFGCYAESHLFSADDLSLSNADITVTSISPKQRRRNSVKEKIPSMLNLLVQQFILKDQSIAEHSNEFFLCFNSEATLNEEKTGFCQFIQLSNPNFYYTYYCLLTNEMVAVVS